MGINICKIGYQTITSNPKSYWLFIRKVNKKFIAPIILGVAVAVMLTVPISPPLHCSEDKGDCYSSTLTRVIDGDTIKDADDRSIGFSLVSAPELSKPEGIEAKEYIESVCPLGSSILVDEDDLQLKRIYDATMAKITCRGINLNQSLLISNYGAIDMIYCKNSEFSEESWARACN